MGIIKELISQIKILKEENKIQDDKIKSLEIVLGNILEYKLPQNKSFSAPPRGINYEIDVKNFYLIERDNATGEIVLDGNGNPKRSHLYNVDETKSIVVWDDIALCWRLYAVYAPGI
jgi:hypothetical protein